MTPWLELSQRFLDAHGLHDGADVENRIGPTEDIASTDILDAFRACEPADAVELRRLLRDERHRLFVKLLILATETVPEPLFEDTVRAGVMTGNPSFNKHFIWPCTISASSTEKCRAGVRPGWLKNARAGGSRTKATRAAGAASRCSNGISARGAAPVITATWRRICTERQREEI